MDTATMHDEELNTKIKEAINLEGFEAYVDQLDFANNFNHLRIAEEKLTTEQYTRYCGSVMTKGCLEDLSLTEALSKLIAENYSFYENTALMLVTTCLVLHLTCRQRAEALLKTLLDDKENGEEQK